MKMHPLVAACILLAGGASGAASAYDLSPTSTKFTLTGGGMILIDGQFAPCTITMTGTIPKKSKKSEITSFVASGCTGVTATGLPWMVHAVSADKAAIENFAYTAGSNTCDPKTIHPVVQANGEWYFHANAQGSSRPCSLEAVTNSSPPITIVP